MKNVRLVGFSQDVLLADENSMQHFLVFQDESGRSFRLPVGQETVKELTRILYVGMPGKETEEQESPTEEPGATVFGGAAAPPQEPEEEEEQEPSEDVDEEVEEDGEEEPTEEEIAAAAAEEDGVPSL